MIDLLAPYWSFIKGLFRIFSALISELVHWVQLADRAEVIPPVAWMLLMAVALAVYLASGFAAGTISEVRGHSVTCHFWMGMLLPGLYPAMLYTFMGNSIKEEVADRIVKEKTQQHRQSVELTARLMDQAGQEYQPSELPDQPSDSATQTVAESQPENDTPRFDKIFFNGIAMRPDGIPAGPFVISLSDGRVLEAEIILEILEDVLIVQIVGPNGQPRKLRLTYDLIAGCELKNS